MRCESLELRANLKISLSVGIAACGVDGDTVDELIYVADTQMYRSKLGSSGYGGLPEEG